MKGTFRFLLALIFIALAQASSAQQSKDITPPALTKNNFRLLTTGRPGFIYAEKRVDYKNSYLMQYDGKSWTDISIEPSGWNYVENLVADATGKVFLLAQRFGVPEYKIYYRDGNRWDSVPKVASTEKLRQIYVNPSNELMALGRFENEKGKFYLAKWINNQWQPFATNVKNNFVKARFDEGPNEMVMAKNGTAYVLFFVSGKPSRNYFAQWDGKDWKLLDTAKLTWHKTVRSMAVNNKGALHVAGSYKDDYSSYCIAKWEDDQWKTLTTKEKKIETIAFDENDNLYAAGEFGDYNDYQLVKWSGEGQTVFGTSDAFFTRIVFSNNTVYASVDAGSTNVYSMVSGGGKVVMTEKYDPQKNAVINTSTKEPVKTEPEKKDLKAAEVWQLYNHFKTTHDQESKLFFNMLKTFLATDDNGNFTNQPVWKSSSQQIIKETGTLRTALTRYKKQIENLQLGISDNDLAIELVAYYDALFAFYYTVENFMNKAKFGTISQEVRNAYGEVEAAQTTMGKKEDRVNATILKYKKRNGIF